MFSGQRLSGATHSEVIAYDAAYVALAEALPAPLVSCDGRLASAPGHTAKLEIF